MTEVSTQVFETYNALNALYSTLKLGDQPTANDVESLNAYLITLRDLDGAITTLESGPFDVINRKELALRQRAAAWLLGWAAFSRILISFSRQSPGQDVRQRLILLSEPSTLGLLLAIYRQLVEADLGKSEPLQLRLKVRTGVGSLSYTERVKDEEGSPEWYIPSSADIVGQHDDDPSGRHDILSLWGLVNLQLDTWYASAPEYRPQGCGLREVSSGDGSLSLSPLADWLEDIDSDARLAPFGHMDGFKTPISKIVKFLRFRERYASEQELATLCGDVRKERLRDEPQIPEPLKPLVEAATPAENGEQLYDASIWLRYVVLLSFDRERSVITDVAASNNLEKMWQRLRPGEPYVPVAGSEAERRSSSCAPFLRWNAVPYSGNASAVLADLVGATYRYLTIERRIRELERDRFQTVSKIDLKASGRNYAKKLNEQLEQLRGVFRESIQPYFPSVQVPATVGDYRPSDWADPSSITRLDSPWGITFLTSCTPSEQERLAGDHSIVAKEIKSTEAKYSLLRQAYDQVTTAAVDLREVSAILEPLGGLTALSNWNLYRLPSKRFDDYVKEFESAIKLLKDDVDARLMQEQLAQTFRIKREEVEGDYFTMLAVRLGRDVAVRAINIAQIYQRINELYVQIEELGGKIARLDADAWKTEKEKAGAKLAYATRMRDLVAARIEALTEASAEAAELARSAEKELETMAEQLRAAARTIEDNKSSAAIFSIVKVVVSVVGAALGPITGGASIAIATLVNMGIDIYVKASKMNWDNLGQAVANLEELGPALANGISFAVDNFGSTQLKSDFAKVSAFVKSTREKLQQTFGELKENVEKLGIELRDDIQVKSIIDAVQRFEKADDVLNFATAIANGYTLNMAGTTVRIDFRGKQVTFTNNQLRQGLQELYAAGHIIINDAAARAEGLTNLAVLPDEELRRKLYESFRGAIGQLPPEFLGKLKLKVDESKKKAEQALERVKETIAKEMSSQELRLFAQLLAAGCLFVKDGEVVVAIDPPPLTDGEKLRQRIESYKKRVDSTAVNDVRNYWLVKEKELREKSQELSASQDEQGLRDFADGLAGELPLIKARLEVIAKEIEDARDELEDKDTEVGIADYEAKADALFTESAEARVQQADLREDQAKLTLEMAREIYISTLTDEERASALVGAEMRRVESGELALIQAYEKCLAMGFNPLSPTADFDSYGAVSIRKPLSSFTDLRQLNTDNEAANAADSLMGMIQWANLLGVRSADMTKSPTGLYFRLVEALTVDEQPGAGGESVRAKLTAIQGEVEEGIGNLNLGDEVGQMVPKGSLPFGKITWLERPDLTDQQREERAPLIRAERAALLARVANDEYKDRVIGLVRVVVDAVDAVDEAEGDIKITRPTSVKEKMYYADIGWVSPIASKGDNLSFLVLPPASPRSHPGTLSIGAAAIEEPDDIPPDKISDLMEKQYRENLKSLIKTLRLTGALGHWTVLILTTGGSAKHRVAVTKKLKDDEFQIDALQMMFIQVPTPK